MASPRGLNGAAAAAEATACSWFGLGFSLSSFRLLLPTSFPCLLPNLIFVFCFFQKVPQATQEENKTITSMARARRALFWRSLESTSTKFLHWG